ncbi:MAG: hypothetical protein GKR90_02590 [Pseudomonadales bacterium]|nr:hypothetical protein [Pseudomonadales bacterium]
MTPAEVIASAGVYNEAGLTLLSIYLTVLSAYLVMAYVAGADLRTSQLVIINLLFLTFAGLVGYGAVARFYEATLVEQQYGAPISSAPDPGGVMIWVLSVILSLGVFGALKFMSDIRKKEDAS